MELNNLELNAAELNGGGIEVPPPSNEASLEFSFSSSMLPNVTTWVYYNTPLVFIQRIWVPTTHYEYHGLGLSYAPFVPETSFKEVTLDVGIEQLTEEVLKWGLSTDFNPYKVSQANYIEVHATVLGVRTWVAPLDIRYTILRTYEVVKEATLSYKMGINQESGSLFELNYGAFDFIPLQFEFGASVELLTQEEALLELPTSIEILTDQTREGIPSFSYGQPVLTTWFGETSGFAYGIGQLTDLHTEWTLDYWLRDQTFVDVGFSYTMEQAVHHAKVSFSWAKYNSADVTFNLCHRMDYGSGRLDLQVAYAVERHIVSGVVIVTGFNVRSGLQLSANINSHLVSGCALDMGLHSEVLSGVVLGFGLNRVVSGVTLLTSLRNRVVAGLEVSMPSTTSVRDFGLILELPWAPLVRSGVVLCPDLHEWVRSGVVVGLDILSYNPVLNGVVLDIPLDEEAVAMPFSPLYLSVDGSDIEIASGEVSMEEGAFGWSGSFELAYPDELSLFGANTEFSLLLGGTTYQFIVESKSLRRTSASSVVGSVTGISPSSKLASPRSPTITKTWTTAGTARSIVTEVLEGYPLQWSILDWAIPAHRYSVSQKSPMEIVRDFASAVGAVVDSLEDGTLRVRPRFKESPEDLSGATADHSYLDQQDIFSLVEQYSPRREFDLFRVTDGLSGTNTDLMEYESITPLSGNLRVYPSPFRTAIDVYSTANVTIGTPYYDLRTESEIIEIKESVGGTRFPVYNITGVEWLDTDLGGLSGGDDLKKVTSTDPVNGYSLVKVTYTVRSMLVPVSGADGKHAQFLIRSP